MLLLRKHKGLQIATVALAFLLIVGFHVSMVKTVEANPSALTPTVQTAAATTSPAFLIPGTATSSLTYDAYSNPTSNTYKSDYIALAMMFRGSSTAAVLGMELEYSQDGIDWYKDSLINSLGGRSTTTNAMNISGSNALSWTFASTTVGGQAMNTVTRDHPRRVVMVPTPMRYVRAIFTITGANGAIWAQMIPTKESRL